MMSIGPSLARFKLGFGMADIRGKIGNYVYSIQKTGVSTIRQVAQAVSNPMSPDQAAIRCNLARYAKAWNDDLSDAQRAGWATWALTKPGMGNKDGGILVVIKGNNGIMSGFNAYVMVNQWLRSCALAGVDDAPIGATPPTPPRTVEATWTTPNIVVTLLAPQVKKTGAFSRLWIAKHQPDIHRQLVVAAVATQLTINVATLKGAQGADVAVIDSPGNYIIQMDTVDPDGTKSGPSNVAEVKVT